MRAWLRILRVPFALTAVFDAWACGLLAFTAAGRGLPDAWWSDALLLGLTSFCLYGAGMAANDLSDRKRDAILAPGRPLPSGALQPLAVGVVVLLLIAAALVLGGGPSGSRIAVGVAALLALTYDFGAKRAFLPGVLSMGAVRVANASIAVLPLVESGAAPVWTLGAPLLIGLYSAGITVLSTMEEDPHRQGRLYIARAMAGLAFGGAALLGWLVVGRPTLGILMGIGGVTSTVFGRTPRPGSPKRQVLEMLLGLYFLEHVIASAGLDGHWAIGLGSLAAAFFAIQISMWMLRSLAVPAAPAATPAAGPGRGAPGGSGSDGTEPSA
jgi:4-hydroxybenzoate polyprenyltransferase